MNSFITVPEVTLPNGTVVPSFQVGQFACGKGEDGKAIITPGAKPWVSINYHEARQVCADSGFALITELQCLNGNVYQWVFDNVQGDITGVIASDFAEDSPSITTAPYPSEEKGMGNYEVWDWSGRALIRGGCWYSGSCRCVPSQRRRPRRSQRRCRLPLHQAYWSLNTGHW